MAAAVDSLTSGHYLDDGREVRTVPNDADLFQNGHGVKQRVIDPGTAQELWMVSLSIIGQPAWRARLGQPAWPSAGCTAHWSTMTPKPTFNSRPSSCSPFSPRLTRPVARRTRTSP